MVQAYLCVLMGLTCGLGIPMRITECNVQFENNHDSFKLIIVKTYPCFTNYYNKIVQKRIIIPLICSCFGLHVKRNLNQHLLFVFNSKMVMRLATQSEFYGYNFNIVLLSSFSFQNSLQTKYECFLRRKRAFGRNWQGFSLTQIWIHVFYILNLFFNFLLD